MKYHGKFESPRKSRRMTMVAALALALVLTVSAGGTLAWLFTSTDPVENTFSPGNVDCEVIEKFNGTAKSDVKIKNTGNTDAYIRAAVVVNWINKDGKVCAGNHNNSASFASADGWILRGGYYYYTSPVEADKSTKNLIESIILGDATDGCKQQVTILAQAIQAEGVNAGGKRPVELAWGVTVNADGNISN